MKQPVAIVWWRRHRWRPAIHTRRIPGILDPLAWICFLAHDFGWAPAKVEALGEWGELLLQLAIIDAENVRGLRRAARDLRRLKSPSERHCSMKDGGPLSESVSDSQRESIPDP